MNCTWLDRLWCRAEVQSNCWFFQAAIAALRSELECYVMPRCTATPCGAWLITHIHRRNSACTTGQLISRMHIKIHDLIIHIYHHFILFVSFICIIYVLLCLCIYAMQYTAQWFIRQLPQIKNIGNYQNPPVSTSFLIIIIFVMLKYNYCCCQWIF